MALPLQMRARLEAVFFTPCGPLSLGVMRITVGMASLWFIFSRDLPATSGLPSAFWTHVPLLAKWRYLLSPGVESVERTLQSIAVVALCGVVFGVFPRTTAAISALLLYHLAPLETIYWNPNPYLRGLTLPVLALVALCVSPCGDAISLQRIFTKPGAKASWEYRWPVVFLQLQICLLYFFSGYSKIVEVGLPWLYPSTQRDWLLALNQNPETQVFTTLGPWVAEHWLLCALMGIGSVALELVFPLTLFNHYARRILVPVAFCMHVAIALAMNITVLVQPLYVCFVDWDGLLARWRANRPAPGTRGPTGQSTLSATAGSPPSHSAQA
jgi:hypothetical protein